MRDHAPVTETTNTGTPEVVSEDLIPAASGTFAGGPARSPAPFIQYPAHRSDSRAGEGRAPRSLSRLEKRAPQVSTRRLIMDLAGDCICVACLFVILFVGLFFGGIQ